jgi:uncharacterized protein YprB with RNaseH-like and TPR domain/predicted nuclease with RNAse H fold/dephospho-CoA kinase
MLRHTFCHLPGISLKKELNFWRSGVTNWDDLEYAVVPQLSLFDRSRQSKLLAEIDLSRKAFEDRDASFFASRLPRPEHYRIACSLPESMLFLDIETTGLSRYYDYITLIGVSKGAQYKVFLRGSAESELFEWLRQSSVIVTFNGSLFDLPFLVQQYPSIPIPSAHIDLRFLARRAGYSGGQKDLEAKLRIRRPTDIADMKGEAAPILWHRFRRGDSEALRRLIEYNHADIEGMKRIIEFVIHRLVKKANFPKDLLSSLKVQAQYSETNWSEISQLISIASSEVSRQRQIARITIDDLVFTDREPRLRVVGIDLTGSEARASGWCLLDGKDVSTAQVNTDDELISRTLAARPHVVSIDSPLSLPRGRVSVDDDNHEAGIMRYCERVLKKRGVNVYPALIPSMRRLTARGIALATSLRAHGLPVIESYPGAAQDIMNIPRKRAGIEFLEMGLAEFGVAGPFLKEPVSHDELDAITSAVVGAFFWSGRFERLGEDEYSDEALIIPDLKVDPTDWQRRHIIGLSGPLAAGKTTAARALEKQGLTYGRYSEIIETLVLDKGLQPSRDVMQAEGQRVHKKLGQRWLGRQLVARLPRMRGWVIDGLRFPEDHAFFTELFGPAFIHIHISAPASERSRRYVMRGSSIDEFEKAELHSVESQIARMEPLARSVIDNTSDQDTFLDTIRRFINSQSGFPCRFQW